MRSNEEIFDTMCIEQGWKFDNPKARKFIYECMEVARLDKINCKHEDTLSYYHREGEYAFKVCQSCNEHLD
jgi:7-cyano-7-deazaguanine synthase in queuosine biosynthesis